jgi:tripeptidyl-peptidase-1
MKQQKTTFRFSTANPDAPAVASGEKITLPSGITVDASCNQTITISCLKQLYNAIGFNASADVGNRIGITGYLEQFANIADLQLFYADQRPDALNSSFEFVSVAGMSLARPHTLSLSSSLFADGINPQNVTDAGAEADLDVQFAFGLTFPTPSTFYSTAGRPPFIPDIGTSQDTNEPYTTVSYQSLKNFLFSS